MPQHLNEMFECFFNKVACLFQVNEAMEMVNSAILTDVSSGRLKVRDAPFNLQATLLQKGTLFDGNAFTIGTGDIFVAEDFSKKLSIWVIFQWSLKNMFVHGALLGSSLPTSNLWGFSLTFCRIESSSFNTSLLDREVVYLA